MTECYKCGQQGHYARECTQSGGPPAGGYRGGRGRGGMPSRGRGGGPSPMGGGDACYKCGQPGHFARDCTAPAMNMMSGGAPYRGNYMGGYGGGNCYSCGRQGHFARDCPSADADANFGGYRGGRGGSGYRSGPQQRCYNCGKTGHIARECPEERVDGPRCYNCNEVGHISKKCPKSDGGAIGSPNEDSHLPPEDSESGGDDTEELAENMEKLQA